MIRNAAGESTGTQRDHLQRVVTNGATEKARASASATLAAHPCPPLFAWLYRTFLDLANWRGMAAMGPAPLTLHDVAAYEARYGVTFMPGELDLVKRLDAVSLSA